MIAVHPYLVYPGNCEAAFHFYRQAFGRGSLYIGYYKDVPETARKYFPNALGEKVMHAALQIDATTVIMGNDDANATESPAIPPQRDFYLYMDIDEANEAARIFNELSEGGKIIMPISETFWSSCYGILTDPFGVHWKITSHTNREKAEL